MAETKYSARIKNLFHEYYKRNLSMGEYRAQRKIIIDQMDEEYNGVKGIHDSDSTTDQHDY